MDFPANTGTCQEINGSALLRGEGGEEGGGDSWRGDGCRPSPPLACECSVNLFKRFSL